MAKIDTSTIDGYSDMTVEEKIAALENFEYEDNLAEVQKYKNAASKANSEAAEFKRKHEQLLSEEEKARLEKETEFQQMSEELETLRKEKTVSAYKAKYLAMGYDEKLAEETANAMVDGDTDKVFANQQKFLESHDKSMQVERLKNTARPPAGGAGKALSKEEIMKIKDATERQAAISENLSLFTEGD
ncbi:MAG: hypothetical protein NC122_05045 [Faecalibacterium sp.]|nr:hypothetical protein [Ruminococcus sp.]MCM1391872.1 hypothetical protein [Ruminococcus sp.]MCM1485552.1 hypothetical protein [Faecalibacterium sp.]